MKWLFRLTRVQINGVWINEGQLYSAACDEGVVLYSAACDDGVVLYSAACDNVVVLYREHVRKGLCSMVLEVVRVRHLTKGVVFHCAGCGEGCVLQCSIR